MMTNNHYTLKGKCVLICGGLGWLGSHYSKSIVENGGSLIILDYDTIDNYSDFFSKDNLSNIESHVVDFYDHLLFENNPIVFLTKSSIHHRHLEVSQRIL